LDSKIPKKSIFPNVFAVSKSLKWRYNAYMTAVEKEQIFIRLRKYHTEEFPQTYDTDGKTGLLEDFRELEDQIIGTVLGMVNGKAEYIDYSKELETFSGKIENEFTDSDNSQKKFFETKIKDLGEVMQIASETKFALKRSYAHKLVGKKVTTTITKKSGNQ
jgi:hypothetical protein